MDVCYELAAVFSQSLQGMVTSVDEVHRFRYLGGRSIIGFVDGTENPEGDDRRAFGCIGEDDPDFRGGAMFLYKNICTTTCNDGIYSPPRSKRRPLGGTNSMMWSLPTKKKRKYPQCRDQYHLARRRGTKKRTRQYAVCQSLTWRVRDVLHWLCGYVQHHARNAGKYVRRRSRGQYQQIAGFSTAVTGTLFFAPSADMLDCLAE